MPMPSLDSIPIIDTGEDGLKEGDGITPQIALELGLGLELVGEELTLYDLETLDAKGFFVNQLDLAEAKTKNFKTPERPIGTKFVGK
jgi:hypothetical protein